MTIQTGRTKRQRVRGHKAQIHLTVAPIASIQSERCDVTLMAVITHERFTGRCQLGGPLMGSRTLMREGRIFHDGELRICTAMLGVTMTAAKIRILVQERTVQRGNIRICWAISV